MKNPSSLSYWLVREMARLYVGVTSDLVHRVWQHRTDADGGV